MLGGPALARQWFPKGPQIDPDHLLTIRAVKLSCDGALGSRGAWLLEPYEDRPGPVEPVNPIPSFYASVTRKTLKGQPDGGYEQDQKMTREQALRSYTLDAAYGAFQEKVVGSIEAGKYADFTIFSHDIMEVKESQLLATEVVMTLVGGKVVYGQ